MNIGKAQYDAIPIPTDLDQIIWDAISRAEREAWTRTLRRWLVSAAAVFCVAFLSANITPVYAYASRLAVIGAVVRVLHIGSGGEITDGAHTGASAEGETVQFHFESASEELDAAPVYTVSHLLAPNRIILALHGVRTIDYEAISESLLSTEAVQSVSRAMIGDDSMFGFIIVLNGGWTYEITEYANPASLSVRFYPDEAYQPEREVYYLRSEAVPFGEELGIMNEIYWTSGATQLRTRSGGYIITIGQYDTLDEANAALKVLEEQSGGDTGLFVSSGLAGEIPEK